ncbi:MAG: GFA family protein [Pseudomonadota bacterium]
MQSDAVHTGGCLCGAIRFEAKAAALRPHSCSCKMCQRHSGALTTVWVEFPRQAVTWTGPGGAPATYRSSDYSSRAFCPQCGSTLGAIDDDPVVALLLGGFDNADEARLVPVWHSYRDGAPNWWHFEIQRD